MVQEEKQDEVQDVEAVATRIADRLVADIVIYSGPMRRPYESVFMHKIKSLERRDNIILILTTSGGDADCAYRIARYLQTSYTGFCVYITGLCKSAGTLLVFGANAIIMSDFGELGPLDIQEIPRDELIGSRSGLTVDDALKSLSNKVFDSWLEHTIKIVTGSDGRVSFVTAAEIAKDMTVGLMSPIYKQLDPLHLGELARGMNVARDYGDRLLSVGKNPKDKTLEKFITGYPSHTFVVDRDEATKLFNRVTTPEKVDEELPKLEELLDVDLSRIPPSNVRDEPQILVLSREQSREKETIPQESLDGDEEMTKDELPETAERARSDH